MHIPKHYQASEATWIKELVEQEGFGQVSVWTGERLEVHMLPWVWKGELGEAGCVLEAHIDKNSPLYTALQDGKKPAAVVWTGGNGYVSPRLYTTETKLPTWNYVAVEAHGALGWSDTTVEAHMDQLIGLHDPEFFAGWWTEKKEGYLKRLATYVLVIKMDVSDWKGQWKLSQNKTEPERAVIQEWVRERGKNSLAEWMDRSLKWAQAQK